MPTLAIVNQKGGCGKTTTAINLAGVLARFGERVLLVDMDPQGHAAAGLAVPEDRIDRHIGDAMLTPDEQPIDETRLIWRIGRNLDLAPSAMKLAGLEAARGGLADRPDRDQRLTSALRRIQTPYDWLLIDCPPAIGLLTYNAIRAADEAIIPVETSYFAIHGAGRQINTIRSLARRLGGRTPHRVLVTMHDPDSDLARELFEDLKRRLGERLIPRVIRLDPKLKEAASFGQPLVAYDPTAPGAQDYSDLGAWLLGRPAPPQPAPAVETTRIGSPHRGASAPAPRLGAAPASAPQPVSEPSQEAEAPLNNRAADLAVRAKRILSRSAQLQARLDSDPDVQQALNREPQQQTERMTSHQPRAEHESAGPSRAGPVETAEGVVFTHPAPPHARVCVTGDFNGWSAAGSPLTYNERTGLHEGRVALPPGRCEYRFIVDGRWTPDPGNPSTTTNPYGETNSVMVVAQRPQPSAMRQEGAD